MKKPFTMMAAVLLAVVALMHLARIIWGAEIMIGQSVIPMWVSYIGVVIPGGLAFLLWREAKS